MIAVLSPTRPTPILSRPKRQFAGGKAVLCEKLINALFVAPQTDGLKLNARFSRLRSYSVRHQEVGNLRDDIRQVPRIVRNAFDKSPPLQLLLLVLGKGLRQGIRRVSWDCCLAALESSGDRACQSVIIEFKGPAENPDVVKGPSSWCSHARA